MLSVGTVHIVLTNLTAPLKPGLTYPVTLVLANAGAITLGVPLGSVYDIL
jgi:copper(I)-binding protein